VKTAVLQIVKREALAPKDETESRKDPSRLDLLASFQESVVEMLWSTTHKAVTLLQPRCLMLSGGVAANSRLNEFLSQKTAECGLKLHVPTRILTTDNAAMIAAAGTAKLMRGETAGFDFDADPNMRLAVATNGFPDKRWRV
jgi:N6-L-threonylcarbamoyladenine synthase